MEDSFVLQYLLGWQLPAILCLVVGIILMVVEMFTPGFGAAGGLGIAALIAAVVLRADSFLNAVVTLVLVLILMVLFGAFFIRSMKKGRLSRSAIVLNDSISYSSSDNVKSFNDMIGRIGVCMNTLHPAGNVDFDGTRLDVVTEGGFIQKGSRVRIERVDGVKIIVREVEDK